MFRRRRFAWRRRCGLLCRRGRVSRHRPCRYRTRRQFHITLFRRSRLFRIRPFRFRALFRPCRRKPTHPRPQRLRFLFLRIRFPEVRRFPRSRCPLHVRVRFCRDRDSLFRLAWAMLRKRLPQWLFREPLFLVWLPREPRGPPSRACPAFPRRLVHRRYARVRLQLRDLLHNRCVRRPSRILRASLRPDRSCRPGPTWWRD
jgi:hypothetical protein